MPDSMDVLKLEYKPISPGGPMGYVFTDEDGNENIDDIADKVTAAFGRLEATIQYFMENCDCTSKSGDNAK